MQRARAGGGGWRRYGVLSVAVAPAVLSLLSVLLVTGVAGAGLAAATGVAPAADGAPSGRLLLILDASGSMNDKDPSGLTKLAAAKAARNGVVDGLPDGAQVGLRVYGATVDVPAPTPASCADSQLVHPITAVDRPGLKAAIAGFAAKGDTPIAYSLQQGLKDLGASGKRNIVLVSDGQENCVPDPCPVIKQLIGAGVDLQIDTVGFGVNEVARKQLQCLADAGHGSYYDAADASQLSASLTKLSQRALRPFSVSGTSVTGTTDIGSASTLTPGQYVDTIAGQGAAKYYSIPHTPGSSLYVSVTARPPYGTSPSALGLELWQVRFVSPEGKSCGSYDSSVDVQVLKMNAVAAASARSWSPFSSEDCSSDPVLVARLERIRGGAAAQPVEIRVVEEPAVADESTLPAPVNSAAVSLAKAPVTSPLATVTGGGTFSDAAPITAGTYNDVILSGEQLFYKVHLDFGQSAMMTLDVPDPNHRPTWASDYLLMGVFNPVRASLYSVSSQMLGGAAFQSPSYPVTLGQYVPQVRYRNRELKQTPSPLSQTENASLAGDYYFSVARSTISPGGRTPEPFTLRIRLAVNGTASGQPQYVQGATVSGTATTQAPSTATATPGSGATTTDTTDVTAAPPSAGGGPNAVLLAVGGGLVVAALGFGGYVVLRRRQGSSQA